MRPLLLLILAVIVAGTTLARAADESVLPLTVDSGGVDGDRDARVFSVPARCDGVEAPFVWGCGAWTIVSGSFASKCGLDVQNDPEVADIVDAEGKPLFLGGARAEISVGGRARKITVKVMRDTDYNRGLTGIIGCDFANTVQWELYPDLKKPTLTLRSPGATPSRPAMVTLPLKVGDDDNIYLPITVRNVDVPVMLAPQNTDMQVGPDLQKVWDIASGQKTEVKSYAGDLKTYHMTGAKDVVQLGKTIREANLTVVVIGDKDHPDRTPNARSAIGQSFLNRFHYCVDAKMKRFMVLQRMPTPRAVKAETTP